MREEDNMDRTIEKTVGTGRGQTDEKAHKAHPTRREYQTSA